MLHNFRYVVCAISMILLLHDILVNPRLWSFHLNPSAYPINNNAWKSMSIWGHSCKQLIMFLTLILWYMHPRAEYTLMQNEFNHFLVSTTISSTILHVTYTECLIQWSALLASLEDFGVYIYMYVYIYKWCSIHLI